MNFFNRTFTPQKIKFSFCSLYNFKAQDMPFHSAAIWDRDAQAPWTLGHARKPAVFLKAGTRGLRRAICIGKIPTF